MYEDLITEKDELEIEMEKIRNDYDTELDRLNEKYRNNKIFKKFK